MRGAVAFREAGSRRGNSSLMSYIKQNTPQNSSFHQRDGPSAATKENAIIAGDLPGEGLAGMLAVASEGCSHLRTGHGKGTSKIPSSPSQESSKPLSCPCGEESGGE